GGKSAVLWGLALFALGQLALRIGIEYGRPELRDPTFEIKFRQLSSRLAESAASPKTVIFLGSSTTAHGMTADLVEDTVAGSLECPGVAFNMGTRAAGPLTSLIPLRGLRARGIRPDLVVIELSPPLYDSADEPSDLQRFPANVLEHEDVALV